ncbi:Protein P80 [Termitomyces sp. T112]|nr:Protein P80 [Termitomyces sp. T112]
MDMDGTNTTMPMGDAMIPYLHLTRGDYLLFKALKPTSTGAVAGACICLVLLAIFERWLFAARSALDYHWRRKGLMLASLGVSHTTEARPTEDAEKSFHSKSDDSRALNDMDVTEPSRPIFTRTIPPFILVHDIPRGLLHAGQALLAYVLMLSVMTFNAAYIISIIAGLGIGEVIFGRMGNGKAH